jgi:hypothetical protein
MIRTTIKFTARPIQIKSPSFTAQQMALLGTEGLNSVRERVMAGVGADDAKMPPLSSKAYPIRNERGKFVRKGPPYQEWKEKHGLNPFRDLVGPGVGGHMLDNLSVRYADANKTKIALTSRAARVKALANERRAAWLWWSIKDQERIVARAVQVFDTNVENVTKAIKRALGKAA